LRARIERAIAIAALAVIIVSSTVLFSQNTVLFSQNNAITTQKPDIVVRNQNLETDASRNAEAAWEQLRHSDSTDEGALKHFTEQFPDSALRKQAEARIAELEAKRTLNPSGQSRTSGATVSVPPPAPVAVATRPAAETNDDPQAACRQKMLSKGVYLIPTDPCVDIEELIKKLATGVYRFNKPEGAYVDEPFRLVLTLQTGEGQDITSPFQGTSGKIVERPAPFAQHLEATLRGGLDFRVDPAGAQERTVTSASPVTWEWTVVPLNAGKKTIIIEVAANLIVRAEKEHIQLKTLYEEVQINVRVLHFVVATFANVWGIALGLATMTIAILGVVHYWPKAKREARNYGQSDEPPPVELVTHHIRELPGSPDS
jgi:hypothetical protein